MVYMSEQSAHKHAIISAYLSIIAGLVEAVLSLLAGHAEISMSLYGIALMAIVDITGSVLVLKMWQSDTKPEDRLKSDRIKEMEYSISIGVLMIILGTFLSIDRLPIFILFGDSKIPCNIIHFYIKFQLEELVSA